MSTPNEIYNGSILHVTAIIMAAIEDRLSQPGLPWVWKERFELTGDEENTTDKPTPVYVTSTLTEEDTARNALPRVVVEVQGAQLQQIVVGNMAEKITQTRDESYTAHDILPVTITCHGVTAGESCVIGDLVRWQMIAARKIITERVDVLHDISLANISKASRTKDASDNVEHWVTQVSLTVTCRARWRTIPPAPRLNQITFEINNRRFNLFKK